MAMAEFKFPHETDEKVDKAEFEIEIEGEEDQESSEPEVEIEEQEGFDPNAESDVDEGPDDVSEDELKSYSQRVRKRIKRFQDGYHKERKARESIQQEREQLVRLAQQLRQQNAQLTQTSTKSRSALIKQAKDTLNMRLEQAKRDYNEAYDAGDRDKLLDAQMRLNDTQGKLSRLNSVRTPSGQTQESGVNKEQGAQAPAPQQPPAQQVQRDPKAAEWRSRNTWFGAEGRKAMTATALGYHQELVDQGVDPRSDDYYRKLDSHMRKRFPEEFEGQGGSDSRKKSSTVVAPASRSTGPKKIRLTQSEVSIAKRMGVSLEEYAREKARLEDLNNE